MVFNATTASPIRRRLYVETSCVKCGATKKRRKDSLRNWHGQCKSCASLEVASRPEIKAVLRENGRRTPPSAKNVKHENRPRGSTHYNWRGGITSLNQKIRLSTEMRQWRIAVLVRDGYQCQMCGKVGGDLHADHIKPFSLFPNLRFELSNGRTLCVPCHRQFGALVSHGKITRQAVLTSENHGVIG